MSEEPSLGSWKMTLSYWHSPSRSPQSCAIQHGSSQPTWNYLSSTSNGPSATEKRAFLFYLILTKFKFKTNIYVIVKLKYDFFFSCNCNVWSSWARDQNLHHGSDPLQWHCQILDLLHHKGTISRFWTCWVCESTFNLYILWSLIYTKYFYENLASKLRHATHVK